MRGEGRGLFCKKAPFLPPAPPIHPAKNLAGEDDGVTFPGRPSPARQSPGGMAKKQGRGPKPPARERIKKRKAATLRGPAGRGCLAEGQLPVILPDKSF